MKNEERTIELESILNSMLDPVHMTNRNVEIGLHLHNVVAYYEKHLLRERYMGTW